MNPLADAALRASLVLLAGLACRSALHRRSPALRHAVLAAAIVAAPVVGLVAPWLPGLPVQAQWLPAARVRRARHRHPVRGRRSSLPPRRDVTPLSPASEARLDDGAIILAAWAAGAASRSGGCWSRLSRPARRVARRHRDRRPLVDRARTGQARRRPDPPGAPARVSDDRLLATWGSWQAQVLIPVGALDWSDARVRTVLAHEIAHVVRHDWLVQSIAEALRALLWWNPLAWLACRALRQDSELACDDAVLRAGVRPAAYADDLLQIARLVAPAPVPAAVVMRMARTSTLERRIVAMLNPRLDCRVPTRQALLGAAAALIGAAAAGGAAPRRAGGPAAARRHRLRHDGRGAARRDGDSRRRAAKVETTTDPAGRFRFDGVEPGQHVLQVALAGFRAAAPADSAAERRRLESRRHAAGRRPAGNRLGECTPAGHHHARWRTAAADGRASASAATSARRARRVNVNPVYPPRMIEAGLEGRVPSKRSSAPTGGWCGPALHRAGASRTGPGGRRRRAAVAVRADAAQRQAGRRGDVDLGQLQPRVVAATIGVSSPAMSDGAPDRVLLVTGGSRGIGAATARLAAQRGYAVCVNYREPRRPPTPSSRDIERGGRHAPIAVAGRRRRRSRRRPAVRSRATGRSARSTALVNNAGILETQMRVEAMDAARLHAHLRHQRHRRVPLRARGGAAHVDQARRRRAAPSSTCRRARRGSARRASTSTTRPRRARSTR